MKINKQYQIQGKYMDKINNQADEANRDNNKSQKEKNVTIHISSSAKELSKKIHRAEASQVGKRVEEIKQLVLEDKYPISSEKIADKILSLIEEEKGSEI